MTCYNFKSGLPVPTGTPVLLSSLPVIAEWIDNILGHFFSAFSHVMSHCVGPFVINFNLFF